MDQDAVLEPYTRFACGIRGILSNVPVWFLHLSRGGGPNLKILRYTLPWLVVIRSFMSYLNMPGLGDKRLVTSDACMI